MKTNKEVHELIMLECMTANHARKITENAHIYLQECITNISNQIQGIASNGYSSCSIFIPSVYNTKIVETLMYKGFQVNKISDNNYRIDWS